MESTLNTKGTCQVKARKGPPNGLHGGRKGITSTKQYCGHEPAWFRQRREQKGGRREFSPAWLEEANVLINQLKQVSLHVVATGRMR